MPFFNDNDPLRKVVRTILDPTDSGEVLFRVLPAYAKYLLDFKVREMAVEQYRLAKDLEVPLFQYFSRLPEERIIHIFIHGFEKLLMALHKNNPTDHLMDLVPVWISPGIEEGPGSQVVLEDISLLSFIYRKIFRDFLSGHTPSPADWTKIMEETDAFLTGFERQLYQTLVHEKSEEIKGHEDQYYKMIDEVEDYAILLLTKEGLIRNWNKGAEKIKGYTSSEIIGRHLRIFYSREDREEKTPERLIQQAMTQGKAAQEGWRVRKDGSKFWAYVVITALHDKTGEVTGFLKVTRDLTHKKIAEENLSSYADQLEQKNAELEEKNKELESFAYIASHDLQEPLRKIKLWSNRLEDLEALPEKVQSGLVKIKDSSTRMQALIDGLLNYTQIGNTRPILETTDLNVVLDQVIEDFSEILEEKKAVVEKANLPALRVVKLQIEQLFSNIISNSIKYARNDVPLKITIGSSVVENKDQPSKKYHQITFMDNGMGFKQDYSEKIFEIFQRLGQSVSKGTGIGLAICKKIVQNHGGSITASSEPDLGATFFINLPNND